MNSGHGFTKYGLEKISESVRAYSYLILTSQAAARHGILGDTAPALAAQRIFYDDLKDVINKAVSLEDDIGRYQSVLKYAESRLDYSVGRGLYMLPSDMFLKSLNRVVEGYNNEIVVDANGLELGKNVEPTPKHAPTSTALPSQKRAPKHLTVSARVHTLDDHRDEVQALVFAIEGLSLFAIWWIH